MVTLHRLLKLPPLLVNRRQAREVGLGSRLNLGEECRVAGENDVELLHLLLEDTLDGDVLVRLHVLLVADLHRCHAVLRPAQAAGAERSDAARDLVGRGLVAVAAGRDGLQRLRHRADHRRRVLHELPALARHTRVSQGIRAVRVARSHIFIDSSSASVALPAPAPRP